MNNSNDMMYRTIITLTIAGILLSACQKNAVPQGGTEPLGGQLTSQERYEMFRRFGVALSMVVAESQPVRKLLKDKACEKFDRNYDVLWGLIKDTLIGDKTFQELMAEKTSAAFMDSVHLEIPLLNILMPAMPYFKLYPELYSSSDNELPVIVPTSGFGYNQLYYNGELTDWLERGWVPDFYVLVINQNNRMTAFPKVRSGNLEGYGYAFISPAFDGRQPQTKAVGTAPASLAGDKAIEAFRHFYKEDMSINSMALQRDYIYYGLTPEDPTGPLNSLMSEYLTFIEVCPKAYFQIADQATINHRYEDPIIKNNSVSKKKRDFTQEELIDALWTKGAYNLKVEILNTKSGKPDVLYIPVFPDELWDFNLEKTTRKSTFFKHSKYTYQIDPNKFTAKRYVIEPYKLSLGKWDLSEEPLYKTVTFTEEDESQEITTSYDLESTQMHATQFNGSLKLGLGLTDLLKAEGTVSVKTDNSNTKKTKYTLTVKRSAKSDELGTTHIYFYDPIIRKQNADGDYEMHVYDTGYVTFGVSAY